MPAARIDFRPAGGAPIALVLHVWQITPSLGTSMRTLTALALTALLSGSLSAQDPPRPDGWKTRFDMAGATEADLETFVAMPPGWHVTSGPAGIYWKPGAGASGEFRAELEVFLFDPGSLREAFGIFVGGRDLDGIDQEYTYFLIRNGGQYILKRREGAEAPTLRSWTTHEAIQSFADRGDEASVKNVLVVEADSESIRFFVNDAEVAELPRSEVGVDGIYGFRVNHGLNLHISRLEVKPLG